MTKNQYMKRMRMVVANIRKYSLKDGKRVKGKAKFGTPDFGFVSTFGVHKGEKITSYQAMWDILLDVIKNVPDYMEGLDKIKK